MTTAAEDASLSGWRIKLYELDAQGAWLDRGTGYVDIRVESEPAPALVIVSEEDNSELLRSKVQLEDVYERQGGTLLYCD